MECIILWNADVSNEAKPLSLFSFATVRDLTSRNTPSFLCSLPGNALRCGPGMGCNIQTACVRGGIHWPHFCAATILWFGSSCSTEWRPRLFCAMRRLFSTTESAEREDKSRWRVALWLLFSMIECSDVILSLCLNLLVDCLSEHQGKAGSVCHGTTGLVCVFSSLKVARLDCGKHYQL